MKQRLEEMNDKLERNTGLPKLEITTMATGFESPEIDLTTSEQLIEEIREVSNEAAPTKASKELVVPHLEVTKMATSCEHMGK
jgi:hypothetical protein